VGVDNVRQLEENIEAVKNLNKLTKKQIQEMEEWTKKYHKIVLFQREGLDEYNLHWNNPNAKKEKK